VLFTLVRRVIPRRVPRTLLPLMRTSTSQFAFGFNVIGRPGQLFVWPIRALDLDV
jgi:hypothetical protein